MPPPWPPPVLSTRKNHQICPKVGQKKWRKALFNFPFKNPFLHCTSENPKPKLWVPDLSLNSLTLPQLANDGKIVQLILSIRLIARLLQRLKINVWKKNLDFRSSFTPFKKPHTILAFNTAVNFFLSLAHRALIFFLPWHMYVHCAMRYKKRDQKLEYLTTTTTKSFLSFQTFLLVSDAIHYCVYIGSLL